MESGPVQQINDHLRGRGNANWRHVNAHHRDIWRFRMMDVTGAHPLSAESP
jgi:hypothetical protein